MKIILLEEFPNLGNPGDVVDVKRGYAVNYLLKDDRAIRATKENLEKIEEIKEEQARISAKAGETGKLFGSITSRDIAELLKEEKDINLDRKKILLKEPLRSLGEHEIKVRPYPEVEATLKVNVIAE